MPAKLNADTEAELRKKLRRTARIYLWLMRQQGRQTPAWVCAIRVEQQKTWWRDDRFFTKLHRLVKKGEIEVKIRNQRDREINREYIFWKAAHYP